MERQRGALDLAAVDGSAGEFTALLAVASAQRAIDALTGAGPATLSTDEQHLRITQGDQQVELPTVAAQFVN